MGYFLRALASWRLCVESVPESDAEAIALQTLSRLPRTRFFTVEARLPQVWAGRMMQRMLCLFEFVGDEITTAIARFKAEVFRVGARLIALAGCAFVFGCASGSSSPSAVERTFTNPVLPRGADPWVFYRDGFYYYMHTTARNLTVWKTRSIADLRDAERKVVWQPPSTGPYSKDIWAPEIHFLQGKWYIYFAADDGHNANHRTWVLENASPDPLQGEWVMKGKLTDATDRWAIDASVFENRGRLYVMWSGWEHETNGVQNIYLAAMKNPWTIEGPRVRISSPEHAWERVGALTPNPQTGDPAQVDVNEGPQMLKRGNKLFVVYSASGCWTDHYCLGMLTADGGSNLLDPASWKKSPQPVLSSRPEAQAYAPGHCSFFKSPDGKEDWVIYHANPEPGQGCGRFRSPRAQPISWTANGTPDFGQPVPLATLIRRPSGEAR